MSSSVNTSDNKSNSVDVWQWQLSISTCFCPVVNHRKPFFILLILYKTCKHVFLKQYSDHVLMNFYMIHNEAKLCVKLCPPAPLGLHMMSLWLSFSAFLFTSSVSFCLCFCHSIAFFFSLLCLFVPPPHTTTPPKPPADARCGESRQWLGAEVYGGDVSRGFQPDTHRATDAHGRGQSLHISVQLILCVFLCVCIVIIFSYSTHLCLNPCTFLFPCLKGIALRLATESISRKPHMMCMKASPWLILLSGILKGVSKPPADFLSPQLVFEMVQFFLVFGFHTAHLLSNYGLKTSHVFSQVTVYWTVLETSVIELFSILCS